MDAAFHFLSLYEAEVMNFDKKLCMQQGFRKGRRGMHKAVGSRKNCIDAEV